MMRGRVPEGRTRRRDVALCRTAAGVVLTALLGSCTTGTFRPRFPQVEQATEAVHGGGERFSDHRTCMQASKTVDDLIQCMDAAHWHFVTHGGVFPEPQCWEARERAELERLAPDCFIRAPEHP